MVSIDPLRKEKYFNPLPHRDDFQHFCKQSRPRSDSLYKSFLMFAYGNMIRYDPTLVDLTVISMYKREKFI